MAQQIVDLTVTLSNNRPGHRFFPRPVILPHFTHDEMETWGNGTPEDPLGGSTTYLGMIDHMGTHIDAFIHTKRGGATIDQMPLEMFMGKAVCLDLQHAAPGHGECHKSDARDRQGARPQGPRSDFRKRDLHRGPVEAPQDAEQEHESDLPVWGFAASTRP